MPNSTRLTETVRTAFHALIGLLYPERCQLCLANHARPSDGLVCADCRAAVIPVRPPACDRCGLPFQGALTNGFTCPNCHDLSPAYTRARSAVHAKGSARDAIHLYKYHRAYWLEPFFQDIWVPAAVDDLCSERWDGVVPVPLHPVREREREFNQAERLGRLLGTALRVPVRRDLVIRHEATLTQTRLSRDERTRNVRRAFAAPPGLSIPNTRWIVVDDVLTTGSTTDAVARVLRSAGAEEVVVWTVARGV